MIRVLAFLLALAPGFAWGQSSGPNVALPSFAKLLTGMVPVVSAKNLTSIDIPVGVAADSTNAALINAIATCTVDIATSGAGGLDTGSAAASTWYAYYVMSGASGTSCVATVATPATAGTPTLPAGYSLKRYVGRAKTDASVHIDTARIFPAGKYFIDATDTYAKPASIAGVILNGCGAGGPGGSGGIQISGTAMSGGGSGGAGSCLPPSGLMLTAADIGTSLVVTLPAQPAGGAAVTNTATTAGNTASVASPDPSVVNSGSTVLLTLYNGGPGSGAIVGGAAAGGGGSAGHAGDGGAGSSGTGGTAGAGQGIIGSAVGVGTTGTISGIGGSGAASTNASAGFSGGHAFGGGAPSAGGSGGGVEIACSATTHSGGSSGSAWPTGTILGIGGTSANGFVGSTAVVISDFGPGPGGGGGWGGPQATHAGAAGGDGVLGGGGGGGGSACAASGSMTGGAGGKGGASYILLTEIPQ